MNETGVAEVSEVGDISPVSEVIGDVGEVKLFADGSPKNNIEETCVADELLNLSECSSLILHVSDNEGVISFRRDSTEPADIYVRSDFWGDIEFVKQHKESGGYFFHTIVTSNGWLIGDGGITDGGPNHQMEAIACEMVINNQITDSYLSRIYAILSGYSLGHFVIKAPNGTYGVVFVDRYHTGKLNPGEYVLCPNLYSYSDRGVYDSSVGVVDAAIKIISTDPYGQNRRDVTTHHWKLTTSSNQLYYSVDTYASNDNGAGVGLSTGV